MALRFINGKGVVHRDIKPVNLLLRHKGGSSFEGRVIDLGLALSFEDAIEECRASGGVLKGTTRFMPAVEGRTAKSSSTGLRRRKRPEAAAAVPLSCEAPVFSFDLYSLGRVFEIELEPNPPPDDPWRGAGAGAPGAGTKALALAEDMKKTDADSQQLVADRWESVVERFSLQQNRVSASISSKVEDGGVFDDADQ